MATLPGRRDGEPEIASFSDKTEEAAPAGGKRPARSNLRRRRGVLVYGRTPAHHPRDRRGGGRRGAQPCVLSCQHAGTAGSATQETPGFAAFSLHNLLGCPSGELLQRVF